eukprot:m.342624 g.342624  ORF g.342624 m.342624 type:complete len:367 (-) comp21659_c0_seq1:74-1174(-)
MLRVCFVGCGNIANYHVKAAKKSGNVKITCLVDPSATARVKILSLIKSEFNISDEKIPEFNSIEDALEFDTKHDLFDACDIMVPSWKVNDEDLHEKVTSSVLKARKHILLEKPITVEPVAAQRLIDLSVSLHGADAGNERVFAVAENAQFWPEIIAAQKAITRGDIGEIVTAYAKFWESATGEWAVDYLPGSWRCDKSKLPAASFTYDGATHWIRPLRMWLGNVQSIVGVTGRSVPHMAGASCSQHIFQFHNGLTAIFESILAPEGISDQPFFRIQGSKGEIVIDGFGGGCYLHVVGSNGEVERTELCKEGWDEGYTGEYVDFTNACLNGTPLAGKPSEALEDLRVVSAMFESAEKATWVKVAGNG